VGRKYAGEKGPGSREPATKEKETGFRRVLSVVGGGRDKDVRRYPRGHGGDVEGRPVTAREEEIATEEFECEPFAAYISCEIRAS
jgi:hypothetical protein